MKQFFQLNSSIQEIHQNSKITVGESDLYQFITCTSSNSFGFHSLSKSLDSQKGFASLYLEFTSQFTSFSSHSLQVLKISTFFSFFILFFLIIYIL